MQVVRWKAVFPLGLSLALLAAGWLLFGDGMVKRTIEYVGEEVVGARVEVASARVSLRRGSVVLRGLQVANPDEPMRNLLQADEIIARVRPLPLLENKVVLDTMAIRVVRFGTPRQTSGVVARRSATAARISRAVSDWASRVRIQPLSLKGVNAVVDLSRIRPDSLRTIAQARAIAHQGDSLPAAWRRALSQLDPQPQLDSARGLVARLKQADLRALGLAGMSDLMNAARTRATGLSRMTDRVKTLENQVISGANALRTQADGLAGARAADYRYALGVVNLPALDAPDLSPALFGEMAVQRLQPILYWLNLAEQYVPPGLDPRRESGPKRTRAPGTSVRFPREREYPAFLLLYAGADAEVTGGGAAAGRYAARLTGLTTAPAIYGRPARFLAERAGGSQGPGAGKVAAILNHLRAPITDSLSALLEGVELPTVVLPVAGARMALGAGSVELHLARTGDHLDGSLTWRTSEARWMRADSTGTPDRRTAVPPVGSTEWAQDLLWRTLSRLKEVEVGVRVGGRLTAPSLGVRSNVGEEVARALRREMGAELDRQTQRVRSRVDSLVGGPVTAAQTRAAAVQTEAASAVSAQRAELEQVRAELEGALRELTKKLPIRIP